MANITKITEDYIAQHPLIKECVKKGLINYSSLTRLICSDLGLDVKSNFDAILIACRRYYSKIKKEPSAEKKILEILQQSKIEVKNKISAIVLEKGVVMNNLFAIQKEAKKLDATFQIVEGASAITVIASDEFAVNVKQAFKNKIIKENSSLVEVILKSPKLIETTAGVTSYLYSLLGDRNVNIYETLSCWTDTIFLIDEKDIGIVMQILRF